MYRNGLGFSLLPPKSVRQAVARVFGASVSAAERAATQRLEAVAPAPAPNPVMSMVNEVPGGFGTIGVVGAIALIGGALLLARRARKS